MYHIYKILCQTNGKLYIGMSQEYEKRWRSHRNQLRLSDHNNFYLQQDWNKYGEQDFEFSLLHEFDNKEDCQHQEIKLIQSYDSDILYNIVKDSSVGGDYFTHNPRKEEIRKQKSELMAGKNNHQYGKPKTEKMIKRVKEANSKPISIEGIRYDSIADASRDLRIGDTTIIYRLNATSDKFKEWIYV